MTPADISLVKDSFRKVVPISEPAAALFYARLFELSSPPASARSCSCSSFRPELEVI